ncbi:MAG: putative lipid II flippase FtsW [bacterium]
MIERAEPAHIVTTAESVRAVTAPRWDMVLFGVALALSAFGLVMVYSASAVYALGRFGSDTHFALRQLIYAGAGLFALLVAQHLDYRLLQRLSRPLLVVAVILLVAVLVPGLGVRVGGAQRWFRLGPLSLQPSELAKVALMIYLATILADDKRHVKALGTGFLAPLLVVGLVTGLTLLQPDLGTAVLLGMSALLLMFVAGTRLVYILGAGMIAAPLAWLSVVGTPWRMKRLMAFFDPEAHREGAGYQVYEALLTLGSGGLSGMGLGEGQQKLFYLPEAHTDFILPVVGQELGFIGVTAVLVLFALLLWRGAATAMLAEDRFGRYVAFGFTGLLGFQACMNMAVVVGVLPTKGITLPFVSYGGTSLVMCLFMVGVLLSISRGRAEAAASRRSWGLRITGEHAVSPKLKGGPVSPVRISSGGVWRAFRKQERRGAAVETAGGEGRP